MSTLEILVAAVLAGVVFLAGFATGQRYTIRIVAEEEVRNTRRVIWVRDWLTRQQRIAVLCGERDRYQALSDVESAAFLDVPDPPPS